VEHEDQEKETPREAEAPSPPPPPAAEAAEIEKEGRATLEHLQRLQAEFTNYRKRVERERADTAAWAQGALIERLLPALDDLARATEQVEGDDSPAAQGLQLIRDKLTATLVDAGLERIEAVGAAFDPTIHEALVTEPVGHDRVGTVVEELVPGFRFKGRLLRPARVKVGVDASEG
jgi:molecular chaperone GrpE